jgi:hypothetical protein
LLDPAGEENEVGAPFHDFGGYQFLERQIGEFEGDAEPYAGIGGHDQRVSFAVPEQECRHADQLGAFRGKALEIAGLGAVVIP